MAAKTNDKSHYATRDFNDAGTTARFERGKAIDASADEIANYVAAGLASTDKPKGDDPEPATPLA